MRRLWARARDAEGAAADEVWTSYRYVVLAKGKEPDPPELLNRVGTRILPKVRSGEQLSVGVEFSVNVDSRSVKALLEEISRLLREIGVADKVSTRTD